MAGFSPQCGPGVHDAAALAGPHFAMRLRIFLRWRGGPKPVAPALAKTPRARQSRR